MQANNIGDRAEDFFGLKFAQINSGDPAIAIKKSWQEGRLWELRKILKTFAEVRKGEDGS